MTFNPDTQRKHAALDCIAGRSATPKMYQLRWAYGDSVTEVWLAAQLADLNRFCGSKDKMSPEQLADTANIIIDTHGYLTCGEIMEFFRRFKAGKYGRFYGAIDPLVITTALQDFLADRAVELQRLEEEYQRKQEEIKARKQASPISGREFCRLKGLPETDNIIEIYTNYIKKYGKTDTGTDDSRPPR